MSQKGQNGRLWKADALTCYSQGLKRRQGSEVRRLATCLTSPDKNLAEKGQIRDLSHTDANLCVLWDVKGEATDPQPLCEHLAQQLFALIPAEESPKSHCVP